jgi:hypothetical protein
MELWAADGADAMLAKIQLPEGCFNGETVFVPRWGVASRFQFRIWVC